MMKLNDLDFLSPSITLYHYGKNKHSSNVGGVLTLIGVIICTAYTLYLCNNVFSHNSLSLLYYRKFEYEVGKYSFDKDGIFHFIQLYNKNTKDHLGKYEQKYIRAFISSLSDKYPSNKNIIEYNNHWVYDLCENNDIEQTLYDKIDNFTNGVCIKYYYDNKTGKYYNNSEKEFVYPFIEHGNSRKDNIILGILIEKCNNDSILNNILGPCGAQEDIDNYFQENNAFYLYFIDNEIDPTDVHNPIKKFFNSFSSSLSSKSYPVNHINFNPLLVKSDLNLIFSKIHNDYSFKFDYSRKDSKSNKQNSHILAQISFWIENNFIIYERSYKKLFNIFPTIGGIIEIAYYVLNFINYFYHEYKVLSNSKNLFLNMNTKRELNFEDNDVHEENFVKRFRNILTGDKLKIKKFGFNNNGNIRSNMNCNFQENKVSNEQKLNYEEVSNKESFNNIKSVKFQIPSFRSSENNKSAEKNNINEESRNELNKRKGILRNINNNATGVIENNYPCPINLNVNKYLNQASITKIKNIKFNDDNEIRYNKFADDIKNYINEKKKKFKSSNRRIPFIENEFSFCSFIFSVCCNQTKNNGGYIIDYFRKKLLSEEHLYRSHIYLYLFEKYFEIEQEKTDIVELYKYL